MCSANFRHQLPTYFQRKSFYSITKRIRSFHNIMQLRSLGFTHARPSPGKLLQGGLRPTSCSSCCQDNRQQASSTQVSISQQQIDFAIPSDQSEAKCSKKTPVVAPLWSVGGERGGVTCCVVHKASFTTLCDSSDYTSSMESFQNKNLDHIG